MFKAKGKFNSSVITVMITAASVAKIAKNITVAVATTGWRPSCNKTGVKKAPELIPQNPTMNPPKKETAMSLVTVAGVAYRAPGRNS